MKYLKFLPFYFAFLFYSLDHVPYLIELIFGSEEFDFSLIPYFFSYFLLTIGILISLKSTIYGWGILIVYTAYCFFDWFLVACLSIALSGIIDFRIFTLYLFSSLVFLGVLWLIYTKTILDMKISKVIFFRLIFLGCLFSIMMQIMVYYSWK